MGSSGKRGLVGKYSSLGWNTRTGANLSASSRTVLASSVGSVQASGFCGDVAETV
jgi:hypothetical protein